MIQYRWMLKYLTKKMGSDDTTNFQLNKVGKKLFGSKYLGTFPCDFEPKEKGYYILNLDNSILPGSHWVAVSTLHDRIQYDSFGRKFKNILPFNFKGGRDTELDPEQKVSENNCGQRSLAFLWVLDQFGPKIALTI